MGFDMMLDKQLGNLRATYGCHSENLSPRACMQLPHIVARAPLDFYFISVSINLNLAVD